MRAVAHRIEKFVSHLPPWQVRHAFELVVEIELRFTQACVLICSLSFAAKVGFDGQAGPSVSALWDYGNAICTSDELQFDCMAFGWIYQKKIAHGTNIHSFIILPVYGSVDPATGRAAPNLGCALMSAAMQNTLVLESKDAAAELT